MITEGKIIKCLEDGMMRVEVMRASACSGNCSTCGGCVSMGEKKLLVEAKSDIDGTVGDYVVLEGETRKMLSMAALMYIIPLASFLGLYVAVTLLFAAEGFALACGGIGFAISIICVVLYSHAMKRQEEKPYRITCNLSQNKTNC